ncbi:DUF881 domain-containing protein [Brachybacterium sp. EF45031]|uniref:DUF881 domain-containing protein n=1 Tax=Brachybacterium sillae TaxID=2810536 RepID=UPI00217F0E2A|nr:DUF881 domain-containing protein [Brachybacterium sillae]MCS6710619.1 DUF881 domain-containing protein [Brachybacterium sillae]
MRGTDPSRRLTPHGETRYSPSSLLRALSSDPLGVNDVDGHDAEAEHITPPETPGRRIVTALLAVALGVVVSTSVLQLRDLNSADSSPRAALVAEVITYRERAETLVRDNERRQAELTALQQEVWEQGEPDLAAEQTRLQILSGSVPVSGPAVVLTVDDSLPLPTVSGDQQGVVNRVSDTDLQILVNGLWAAGAEAITVNDQRITPTSAIRTAGGAVLVDFRALSPPYRIVAVGDPTALRGSVESGEAGTYLQEITTRYALRASWGEETSAHLPAHPSGPLQEARPAGG